jgi:hypothetical protein
VRWAYGERKAGFDPIQVTAWIKAGAETPAFQGSDSDHAIKERELPSSENGRLSLRLPFFHGVISVAEESTEPAAPLPAVGYSKLPALERPPAAPLGTRLPRVPHGAERDREPSSTVSHIPRVQAVAVASG